MTLTRILISSYYLPQPDLDSFSRRLFHFVEFLREAGCSVACVAKAPNGFEQFRPRLEALGVFTFLGLEENLERLVTKEHFDAAILGFWYIAEPAIKLLRRTSPATRIIVDSGDLHFLRHARRILRGLVSDEHLEILDSNYASETVRELNVYAGADAVFAVSQREAEFVNDFVGDPSRALVVPDCEDFPLSPVLFEERRGMFFVGNFQHLPNVEAVQFLCKEILPQFDPAYLVHHPVYIAGNAMNDAICNYARGMPFVKMLGWVPSIQPYLERARVSILPLLHGAGTKRKMIQALQLGTPTVSTTTGVEGFDLRDGEEVLIANDPVDFANAVARLLEDEELWKRLARQGRERILKQHGRERGRERLLESVAAVITKPSRASSPRRAEIGSSRMSHREYREVVRRTQESIRETIPPRRTAIIVSKGDDALLNIGERGAWHFPQQEDGTYAGFYPSSSSDAIGQLERLKEKGGDYLVFPRSALWWFAHYDDFRNHLENRYRLVSDDAESCIIFSLRESHKTNGSKAALSVSRNGDDETCATADRTPAINAMRPRALELTNDQRNGKAFKRARVLVLGVYLADRPNNVSDIIEVLSQSRECRVVQQWVGLGGEPPTPRVADVTVKTLTGTIPKFEILNGLIDPEQLKGFDYVIVCDDDIVLPHRFLDQFIHLQSKLEFVIAQPALTEDSFINHPIVEQQRGTVGRETRFVEIGPVVSFHKSVFQEVFPFDLTSPMGWGYENVWASKIAKRRKTLGIVDAVPVNHGLREPVSNYSWDTANRQRELLLAQYADSVVPDPFSVRAIATLNGNSGSRKLAIQPTIKRKSAPRISVVLPTRNRAPLLDAALKSLAKQTLPRGEFEVVVVNDGSADETADVCERWSSRLLLNCLNIPPSGISAAKNLGVFVSRSPIILFFDDDDIAHEELLAEHLKTHARYPLENVAVLGYTDWSPSLEITELMRYVMDIGHYLFSYTNIANGQRLDFTYFWGGRTSCKKSLLTHIGVFRQEFEFGSEDIELGFRISKKLIEWRLPQLKFEVSPRLSFEREKKEQEFRRHLRSIGLSVIFNRHAIQHMNRAIAYDEFCRRCERQGKSQLQFSRLYTDRVVHEWCMTIDPADRWDDMKDILPERVARVHELQAMLQDHMSESQRALMTTELHRLYGWTFDAFKIKGIVDFNGELGEI